jgi:hypothetical protein
VSDVASREGGNPYHGLIYFFSKIHAPNIAIVGHNINQVLTMEAKEANLNVQDVFLSLLVEVE